MKCASLFWFLFFKSLTITSFILGFIIFDDVVVPFVLIIIFTAFDFWTVKNISGRLLVGLKWYSEEEEDGTTVWLFES